MKKKSDKLAWTDFMMSAECTNCVAKSNTVQYVHRKRIYLVHLLYTVFEN